MKGIWQESVPVHFGVVDQSGSLTPAAVFDFFQEAAMNHAEDLGCGREVMRKNGQVWILSRISVLMERRPRLDEIITVRSWPRSWEKLFALRDYDIQDEAGRTAVRGRSGWLIVDIEKRKPLRPQALVETLPPNEGLNALPGGTGALEIRQNLGKTGERKAVYSDIDYNGHVNNVRYVQWMADVLKTRIITEASSIQIDVNYISEIKPDEEVELWSTSFDRSGTFSSSFAFEGRQKGTGHVHFRAEIGIGVTG
jgi:acyl-ACP thioesterase